MIDVTTLLCPMFETCLIYSQSTICHSHFVGRIPNRVASGHPNPTRKSPKSRIFLTRTRPDPKFKFFETRPEKPDPSFSLTRRNPDSRSAPRQCLMCTQCQYSYLCMKILLLLLL